MGLDVLLYDKHDKLLEKFIIEEELHSEIFYRTNNWGSYQYLRKINDYYSPNLHLNLAEVELLKNDLGQYQIFVERKYSLKISDIIEKLSNQKIHRVHIVGD
ncbi:hypothetical protein PCCS19_16020 [Paenibacillus sp. CCS19]|uniref:hypothetical protein n=1 Tax=Paenibacillus sp. CCS19 TaxID=3158387 RepID=UPI0025657847|nr:hypothetical protein [Paenibacillus cellulosilyticus]GMK38548.1 hypothetical protein PCCS19_16020 [Paenibacillus cellulosilyticus]